MRYQAALRSDLGGRDLATATPLTQSTAARGQPVFLSYHAAVGSGAKASPRTALNLMSTAA
jgi:hypothetical protein